MVDRLFNEHPDWHPGGTKRIEWNKRKQAWDQEVAMANAQPRRSTRSRSRARSRAPVAPPPRPLFHPEPDSDDGNGGYIDSDEEEDENFREELLHELALQNRFHFLAVATCKVMLDWRLFELELFFNFKPLVYHEWLNVLGPLTSANVLDYFAACQLFWDPECNNNILRMQSQHLGTSVNLDELKTMRGIEYAVVHAEPPTLFVIHKRERVSPTEVRPLEAYYVYKNTIHKAFDLYSLVSNRLLTAVNCLGDSLNLIRPFKPEFSPRTGYQWNIIDDSPEDGEDPASSTSRPRNQPKRQVTNVSGILAALQTTRTHMDQQQQQQQKMHQEAAASAPGTGPGTRLMSLAPTTPAPEAIPRAVESEVAAGAGAAKAPAPKGQGKKKQKRGYCDNSPLAIADRCIGLSMVAERGA
ncbi:Mediator of RNA polymerase II transcription subunit 6 [Ceratobasidium sp. 414]|nr:Mediator of RNA polymerase II transcription subunit 6 [Ceratobasidium sp. 414]